MRGNIKQIDQVLIGGTIDDANLETNNLDSYLHMKYASIDERLFLT